MLRFAPCLLERRSVAKPWGGRALERELGLALPAGVAVGETWELYDRPEGSSRLRGSNRTVADLLREDAEALLGAHVPTGFGGRFPLLVKYIDAAERLSVQVHPGPEQARADGDGAKTEAWLVLAAGPRARIVCGLRPGVTTEAFAAVAATAAVEPLLHAFRPTVGDLIYVPHGTVHALGPDVVVLEVQQNSDVTYRLYDWGRPRETHLQAALTAVRPTAASRIIPATADGAKLLCDEFTIRSQTAMTPTAYATGGVCGIVNVLAGGGTMRSSDGELDLHPGDTILVPACVDEVAFSPRPLLRWAWSAPLG